MKDIASTRTMRARNHLIRALPGLICAALLAAMPQAALAQAAAKTLRVGILSSGTLELRQSLDQALVEGLQARGYVEGKNLVIERRYSSIRVKDNASELAALKLDAIFTTCTPSTRVMKETTTTTPIVMAAVSDPVQQGLISSLAKPGQNVTGTSSQAEDLLAKRLELLIAVLPRTTTIGVLANRRNPVHTLAWQRLATPAQQMNLRLVKLEIGGRDDLPTAMEAAARAQVGALFILPDDPLMMNIRPELTATAAKYRLPDFHWAREFVESDGLMSYGESLRGSYAIAAGYVDKIKKGASPADLPVEQPTRFELVINLKTAKALGVTVPQAVLLRADEVIQ
jgi:putative ABC transport system substrate-binding protein